MKGILWLWLGWCGLIAAQPVSAPVAVPSGENELQEVLDLLKSRYADPAAVQDQDMNISAVEAVLRRLGPGAQLMTRPSIPVEKPRPIYAELLPHKIGYWRMPTFQTAKGWAPLEKQLVDWNKAGVIGLVLDLRDFEASNDYTGAGQVTQYFTPPGSSLFSIQGLQVPQQVYQNSRTQMLWTGPLIVLINGRTRGAAEAVAAVLHRRAPALILGRSTAGQAALYTETRLSSGRYLRLATAQVILDDGSPLFGRPVTPDIGLYVDDRNEREVMIQIAQGSAVAGVRELPVRQRLSEAALVREDNPEIDAAYAAQVLEKKNGRPQNFPATQDLALMRAMDVLRAIKLANR
jgi:hypothetical protein